MSQLYDIYKGSKQTGNFGEDRKTHKHGGVDLAKPENSPINSRYDGVVKNVGYDKNGYGNYVDVSHGFTPDGQEIVTRYGHANSIGVKKGDSVASGQEIGKVGSTGRSTGPHIHAELIVGGKKYDPMQLQSYITKSKGTIAMQPKGTVQNNQQEIDKKIDEIATATAMAQIQRSPEEEELRKQTMQAILSTLQRPVEMPKEVTIQDIFNSPKQDRFGVYADYLKTQGAGRIADVFGASTWNGKLGRFESAGEGLRREAEAKLQAEQEKALEQQKMQNTLAGNAFRAMNEVDAEAMREDRFNRQMQQQNEQFLKKMEVLASTEAAKQKQQDIDNARADKKLQLEEDEFKWKKDQKNNEVNYKEFININGKSYNVKGLTPHDRNKISENSAIINSLNEGLKVVSNNPKAFGLKGATPAWIQGQKGIGTPAGKEARTRIGSLSKEYKKYLTGVASNKAEEKDFLRYVPAPYDSDDTLVSKINSIKKIAEDKNKGILDTYYYEEVSATPQNNNSNGKGWAF